MDVFVFRPNRFSIPVRINRYIWRQILAGENLMTTHKSMFEQDLITEIQTLLKNVSILYKYVDFNGGLELLSNSNLLIKNPTQFNDPYDCFPGLIDFDKMPDDYIKYLINKYDSHLNRKERRDKIKFNHC